MYHTYIYRLYVHSRQHVLEDIVVLDRAVPLSRDTDAVITVPVYCIVDDRWLCTAKNHYP